ncbi:unnamed protein product [Dibothriocephalus latus]|uniref:Uncharacterized protein n=1 Tax=Dibothriocephalus latus TaxID=60516 RepID=A0A3P7P1M9_DIBLA|nr:unnamed protein product [Dibothriocephalus latus]
MTSQTFNSPSPRPSPLVAFRLLSSAQKPALTIPLPPLPNGNNSNSSNSYRSRISRILKWIPASQRCSTIGCWDPRRRWDEFGLPTHSGRSASSNSSISRRVIWRLRDRRKTSSVLPTKWCRADPVSVLPLTVDTSQRHPRPSRGCISSSLEETELIA